MARTANRPAMATKYMQDWDALLRLQRTERTTLALRQAKAREAMVRAAALACSVPLGTMQAQLLDPRRSARRALTPAQCTAIRASGATLMALAAQFGVSTATISRVRAGLTYRA
jgi:hypothetical protein